MVLESLESRRSVKTKEVSVRISGRQMVILVFGSFCMVMLVIMVWTAPNHGIQPNVPKDNSPVQIAIGAMTNDYVEVDVGWREVLGQGTDPISGLSYYIVSLGGGESLVRVYADLNSMAAMCKYLRENRAKGYEEVYVVQIIAQSLTTTVAMKDASVLRANK